MKDEALRLALEGFEKIKHHFDTDEYAYEVAVKSITAIKQALEETQGVSTEPEPVAWKDRTYGNLHHQDFGNSIPLYTSPPKREWQGLTDEDKQEAFDETQEASGGFWEFAEYLEAKLKAKNGFPQTEKNT